MKTNKPPCGSSCPNRTPTCRRECEAFKAYDKARLEADEKKQGTYDRRYATTYGGDRRYINNLLWKLKKSRGELK